MRKIGLLLLTVMGIFSCGVQQPRGELVYCSYACAGAAGLGKDYCELIADEGSEPKVVVVLDEGNRFGDPVIHEEYPVERSVVVSLQELLATIKFYKLDGYNLEEPITGGHSYRLHAEYSSGEKLNAYWYGNGVKDKVLDAYFRISAFFNPWREKAEALAREKKPLQ